MREKLLKLELALNPMYNRSLLDPNLKIKVGNNLEIITPFFFGKDRSDCYPGANLSSAKPEWDSEIKIFRGRSPSGTLKNNPSRAKPEWDSEKKSFEGEARVGF